MSPSLLSQDLISLWLKPGKMMTLGFVQIQMQRQAQFLPLVVGEQIIAGCPYYRTSLLLIGCTMSIIKRCS